MKKWFFVFTVIGLLTLWWCWVQKGSVDIQGSIANNVVNNVVVETWNDSSNDNETKTKPTINNELIYTNEEFWFSLEFTDKWISKKTTIERIEETNYVCFELETNRWQQNHYSPACCILISDKIVDDQIPEGMDKWALITENNKNIYRYICGNERFGYVGFSDDSMWWEESRKDTPPYEFWEIILPSFELIE